MSELQFPKDPIVGQQYDFPPYKYYWDGIKWKTMGIGYNPVNDLRDEVLPTTREAIRRSYAEAGLNLVDGSFEEGGTLVNTNDVLLYEAEGKAYSWGEVLPKTVPTGSTPTSAGGISATGWLSQSGNLLRLDIGFIKKSYRTLGDMILDTSMVVNSLVETSSYYDWADEPSGGGRYLITTLTAARTKKADQTWTPDGLGDHYLASGLVALLYNDGVVCFTQFGAKRNDLGFDSAPAIQACINHCNPFKWKGTVNATANSNIVSARIESVGTFRIDSQIFLAPYIDIRGSGSQGYFANINVMTDAKDAGLTIIPFFSNKDQYAFDTAPYNDLGVREPSWNRAYVNSEFDGGKITAVSGIRLDGMTIQDPTNSGIFGGLRMACGIGFSITNCKISGFKVPYFENVCWGHTYHRLHLNGFWAGFSSLNGTVGTDMGGMYNDGFDYAGTNNNPHPVDKNKLPDWWIVDEVPLVPADSAYLSTGIYLRGGSGFPLTSFQSPIVQGYERAVAANSATVVLKQPYFEHMKNYCVTGYWSTVIVEEPFLFSSINIPFWYVSGGGTYNLRNPVNSPSGPMKLNHKVVDKWVEYNFEGIPPNMLPGSIQSTYKDSTKPLFNFSGSGDINNTATSVTYYVDNAGSDSNIGLTKESALKSINVALGRVREGQKATIFITANQTHLISDGGGTASNCTIEITSDGSHTTQPTIQSMHNADNTLRSLSVSNGDITFNNVYLNVVGSVVVNFWDTLIHTIHKCNIAFRGCGINIAGGFTIIRVGWEYSSQVSLSFEKCVLTGAGTITKDNSSSAADGRIILTVSANATTTTVTGFGSNTKVIYSDI